MGLFLMERHRAGSSMAYMQGRLIPILELMQLSIIIVTPLARTVSWILGSGTCQGDSPVHLDAAIMTVTGTG